MARIAGVDLPRDRRIEVGLTAIFGIGIKSAGRILEQAGVDPHIRVNALSEQELNQLRKIIEASYKIEGSLRGEVNMNIKRLMDIGCYRGLRHRRGLPSRGQRTKTNSRTRKGPRRTVAGRKKAPQA